MLSLALILAQEAPSGEALKTWFAVAFYIVGGAASVVGLLVGWKSLNEKKEELPNPLIVQQHQSYVLKSDFEKALVEAHGRISREKKEATIAMEAFVRRCETDLTKLGVQVTQYNENAEGRTDRINDRIDKLNDTVAQVAPSVLQLIRNAQSI